MTRMKEVMKDVKLYQLGQLFALPLQSAIRAQNLALQETISFIEQFGLERGVAKTFHFKAERMVEERKVDPTTGSPETQFQIRPFEISIPLLALIQPPNMQLQEMNVEFGVEVVEPRVEPIQSTIIPSPLLGTTLAPSLSLFTKLSQSNPSTMKVNMKIVREIPEGMARIMDILVNLLGGRAVEKAEVSLPVGIIEGIDPEIVTVLRERGISTVKAFLEATETVELREELARTINISLEQIKEWRERGKLLIKEKEEA